MSKRRVLILGASGFLGTSLSLELTRYDELEIVSPRDHALFRGRFKDFQYSDSEAVGRLLADVRPAIVINCVGIVGHQVVENSPELAEDLNVRFPVYLGNLCRDLGVHLIHFSTDSVYSSIRGEAPFAESSPTEPFSTYGWTKLRAERLLTAVLESVTILRVNFFGWSRDGNRGMLDHFVSAGLEGRTTVGFGRYTASSIYVGDLARVVAFIVFNESRGIFNVGSSDSISKFQFGLNVAETFGWQKDRVVDRDPSEWLKLGVDARDLSMNSSLIQMETGIALPSQSEGIRRALSELGEFLDFAGAPSSDERWNLVQN